MIHMRDRLPQNAIWSAFGISTAIMSETGKALAIYVSADPMMTPGYVPPDAIPEGSRH